MDDPEWTRWYAAILGLGLFGVVMVVSFVLVLRWAKRNGQFKNLDEGAKVIFDEDEPEGTPTDHFPTNEPDKRHKRG